MKKRNDTANDVLETSALLNSGEPKPLVPGFDLEALKVTGVIETPVEVKRVITHIPIRKPANHWFIRCHPGSEYAQHLLTIEWKVENQFYVVHPALLEALRTERLCVFRALIPYVTGNGELLIWPIRIPGADGRIDDYNRSALEHADRARREWVNIQANRELGCYDFRPATGDLGDPKFPAMTPEQMYEIALKDRIIASPDHVILKKLRGEVA
jgi:hypothetical protein